MWTNRPSKWTRRIALAALVVHAFRYMAKHPSRVIGPADNPYMLRWHIVRVRKLPRVYVHRFMRSDDDRALHDHPWRFVSILLTGSYIEHTPRGPLRRTAPSVAHRDTNQRHRIELVPGRTVRTLFITGPVVRTWGFWCPQYLEPASLSLVKTMTSKTMTSMQLKQLTSGQRVYIGERFIPAREFDGCD